MVQERSNQEQHRNNNAHNPIGRDEQTGGIGRTGQCIMVILCLALAFCGICGGESNTQPQFPHMFYGTATITGSPAPEGYTITTAVDGAANGMIIVSPAGIFGGEGALDQKLIVQGDFQGSTSRITFTVEGSPALCREYGSGEGWQESYPFTP
ncbi:MAG TPA: hypothetical protein PLK38_05890, partial [Methanoregulaceae archaeon]|nr:hypothetical protein [Methanoregulaceae archaeon]